MALASSMAHAGEGKSFGTVSGNIDFASEYVFRGLPSSGNAAAVSGGLDWSYNNLYAGTWLSTASAEYVTDSGEVVDQGNEVDLYGGITVGDLDFGAIAYLYPASPVVRTTKLLELYAGYNKGMFSGYVYYGVASAGRSDDDYIYLDGNITAPLSDTIDLGFHLGYTIFHGKTFDQGNPNYSDDQVDVGFKVNHASGFWLGATSILENNSNSGLNERPRVNIGYSMTFDDLYDIVLNL